MDHLVRVPSLVSIGSGSIGELVLDSVDSSNIGAPVEGGFSGIQSVSGAGVLATGWQFPDAVMANGVPYLSASSGLPSIKVGGCGVPLSVIGSCGQSCRLEHCPDYQAQYSFVPVRATNAVRKMICKSSPKLQLRM